MAGLKQSTAPSALAVCVAGALSMALAMGIGRFAFTPMLPLMIRDAQIDVAGGGWLAAANYFGYLLGAVTASRIRLDAARLSMLALLLTAALTGAMALPGPAWLWMALRLLAGVCSAWAFIATSIWALAALAQLRRPAWSTAVYAGVGAGMALAGLFCLAGGALGTAASALWLQLALLALVLAVPIAAVLRRIEPESIPRERSAAATPMPRGATGLILSYAAFGFGYILPATFLPVMARSVIDDPRLFGLAWPVFGAMAVLSNVGAGWCMRHASRLQVWAGAQLLMGIGVLLPSLWLNGWTIALAALLVGGTFMAVTMTAVQESRARSPQNPTAFVSRMTAGFAVGQIAGPVCSSLLLYLPWARAQGLNIALQAAAAGLVLSAAWLWREHQKNSHLAVAV